MGQMTQCEEGHYYDKSLNKKCPHCGVGTVAANRGNGNNDDKNDDKNDEKTIIARDDGSGKFQSPRRDGARRDDVTQAIWRSELGIDPVVGWLVCYEGPNQGRDYRVCSGRNMIGRDPSSQICLRGDDSVSRNNHAKIFYDTRNRSFHVTEGEGRTGIYVNDKVVLQPTELKAYDKLDIGHTKLVFVPLCGDKFHWNEKAGKGSKKPPPQPSRETGPEDDDDDDRGGGDGNETRAI